MVIHKEFTMKTRVLVRTAAFACATCGIVFAACQSKPAMTASATQDGCWVEVFEDDDFSTGDAHARIEGPGRWDNMRGLPGGGGKDWGDCIGSIRVGPHARVIVWEDEGFGDTRLEFGPGSEQRDLNEVNFDDEIDSIEIQYVP
jgi:hypothetical protein